MIMRRTVAVLALWALLVLVAGAQPIVQQPNFSVELQAFGIAASGESMAVDWQGNVYILDRPGGGPIPTPDSITKVTSGGQVVTGHVSGLGVLSQIAYNPSDGYAYVAAHNPMLPVVLSYVYRIEPAGGATQVGLVNLIAEGMTIDDDGRFYFGTQTALQGPGLYRWNPTSTTLTYLGGGFGHNRILQSLARTGDVLIGEDAEVRRWTPMAAAPVPYWAFPPTPLGIPRVNSIARSTMNQLGVGALIGVNEAYTIIPPGGMGYAFPGDLTSGANVPFATESYTSPFTGLRSVASGTRQDLVWLTDNPGPTPAAGKLLWRITQDVAHGSQGSLITDVVPNPAGAGSNITVHIYGPTAGGDPFLFGTIPLGTPPYAIPVNAFVFLPPYGWLMNIFHPAYIPILDGVGVFGPPNPFAVIPPGGHFHFTLTAPPMGGFAFMLQALTLSNEAPNGYFFISNKDMLIIP